MNAVDEVRPLTAGRLLAIWRESRKEAEDPLERVLLSNAQILSESCFVQGEPVFADADAVLSLFQTHYAAHCQIKTAPYLGIVPALEKLMQRYPVAIVSNKPDRAVKTLCRQYFPGIPAWGETPDCSRKPAPDMVFKAMKELNVTEGIYIGDSEVDVLTAKNAGVPCLTVLWGLRTREQLEKAGAKYYCEKAEDLPKMIQFILQEVSNGQ